MKAKKRQLVLKKICHIDPPMFFIDDVPHNEYELRSIMVMANNGTIKTPIEVRDIHGDSSTIMSNGMLDGDLFGLGLNDDLAIQLLMGQV
jgi:hypothetical protein